MYNTWYPLIGYLFIAYIIFSIACIPCFIGYAVYKVVDKIKLRKDKQNDII